MAQNIARDPTRLGPGGDVAPEGALTRTPAEHPGCEQPHLVPHLIPATLGEEEETETIGSREAQGIAALAGNPAFAQLVQGRLSGLIGRSSGYVESLPPAIQYRLTALKGVQRDHSDLEAEFQKDIFELEKKYAEKYRPLYERRRALVEGKDEPKEDEIEKGVKAEEDEDEEDSDYEDEEEEEEEKEKKPKGVKPSAQELESAPKGIPEFWLTALKNHLGLSELITERDEEALKHLVDIRVAYPEGGKSGFTLVFEFGEGAKAFFENTSLEKTYYYQDEVGYEGDFVYDHAEGTKIQWKEGKDLTVRIETKKQRNKNTNQTRIVKKVVPTDSFFSFFSPPKPPSPDDASDVSIEDDLDEKLELDYQIGEDLKERVVPRAIDFFTGKALRYEQGAGADFDSDEFDDEFDEDDEESEEDGDGPRRAPVPPAGNSPHSAQDPAECKQQ
ncbi:SPOSA6832_04055 [Sporobolomyces salmonicolor]|uniref:SPOSA6832_04055-mRNA-1:cds n=1 Tax=Sporidiobolus salmonicolor TaxID=5005 RepID=A0A0D6ERR7_SPOSA|nr:SPOSA6832_04055 [Sporobolomyces salmonicolor]